MNNDLVHLCSPFHLYEKDTPNGKEYFILEHHPTDETRYRIFDGWEGKQLNMNELVGENPQAVRMRVNDSFNNLEERGFQSDTPGNVTKHLRVRRFEEYGDIQWVVNYPEWEDGTDGFDRISPMLHEGESINVINGIASYKKVNVKEGRCMTALQIMSASSERGMYF